MIAAYCWPQSAKANEKIVVYCHTEAKSFQYEIVRQGIEDKTVLSETNISGRTQNIADNIAEQGSSLYKYGINSRNQWISLCLLIFSANHLQN